MRILMISTFILFSVLSLPAQLAAGGGLRTVDEISQAFGDWLMNSQERKLQNAIWNNDVEKVKDLLKDGRVNVKFVDPKSGHTMLTLAAMNGHAKIVKLLVKHGAKINKENPFTGHSALFYSGTAEVAQLLVEMGADTKKAKRELNKVLEGNSIEMTHLGAVREYQPIAGLGVHYKWRESSERQMRAAKPILKAIKSAEKIRSTKALMKACRSKS